MLKDFLLQLGVWHLFLVVFSLVGPTVFVSSSKDLALEELVPEVAAMHRALRALVNAIREKAESTTTGPLTLHVTTLGSCGIKVKEADDARALQKHYEDKVRWIWWWIWWMLAGRMLSICWLVIRLVEPEMEFMHRY